MNKILVDTNVLVYAIDEEPGTEIGQISHFWADTTYNLNDGFPLVN